MKHKVIRKDAHSARHKCSLVLSYVFADALSLVSRFDNDCHANTVKRHFLVLAKIAISNGNSFDVLIGG